MRITNQAAATRYYSYAGSAQLRPGQSSIELPFERLLDKTLWKDYASGMISIRLSESDKTLIARAQAADQRPLAVKPPLDPPKPKPVPKAKVPVKVAAPALLPAGLNPPILSRSGTPGQPDFQQVGAPKLPEAALKRLPSLADLKDQNKQRLKDAQSILGGKL